MNPQTEFDFTTAKEWTKNFINNIKDGGVWGIPRSSSAYQIWHSTMEYKIISHGEACVDRVLEALGYKEKPHV